MSTATIKTVHGWAFPAADEFMSKELRPDGTYQMPHLRAALRYVTDFSCAIDAGAHVGTWAKPLAAKFGVVIAIEPSPDTFDALIANMKQFQLTNVAAKSCALGAKPGTASMHLDPVNADRKNTGARHVRQGGDIAVETIDSWRLPSLGFLKLDVEGSEPDVLEGAKDTLRRCKPVVLFENKSFWTRYGKPKDAPQMVLRALGYRYAEKCGHDEIWLVPA